MISAYGKIIPLDNGKVSKGVLDGACVIQEKIDGSQVSFRIELVDTPDGMYQHQLPIPVVRSKNQVVQHGNKMFQMVLDWVESNVDQLNPHYIYRGEAVTSLKHNTLKYERVPAGGVVVYDIFDEEGDYMLAPSEVEKECRRLGIEAVRTYIDNAPTDVSYLKACIEHGIPQLGGKQIEGVVVKRYDLPDPSSWANTSDKQGFLKLKLVSDSFKEIHHTTWKANNPNGRDVVSNLVEVYGTDARLAKAVQHLRDDGELEGTPKDIGKLIGEVARDLTEECEAEIKEALWKHFGRQIIRSCANRMPNYYKTEVLGLV